MFSFYPQPNSMSGDVLSRAAEHVAKSRSLEELLFNWLEPRRELRLESGIDEYGEPGLCVSLINGRVELGYAWVENEFLKRCYPHVKPIAEAVSARNDGGGDAAWFEKLNSRYSRRWDTYLLETVIDHASALDCSVSYALSENTQVNVSLAEPGIKEQVLACADADGCIEQYSGMDFIRFQFLYGETSRGGKKAGESIKVSSETFWVIVPEIKKEEVLLH